MTLLNEINQPIGILSGTRISIWPNSSSISQDEINRSKFINNEDEITAKSIEQININDTVFTLDRACTISSIQTEKYHGPEVKITFPEIKGEINLLPFHRVLIPRRVKISQS